MNIWKAIFLKLVDELRETENFDWLSSGLFTEEEWAAIEKNLDVVWERDALDNVPSAYKARERVEGPSRGDHWEAAPMVKLLEQWRDRGLGFDRDPTLMGGDSMDIAGQLYNYVQRMDDRVRGESRRVLEQAEYGQQEDEPPF